MVLCSNNVILFINRLMLPNQAESSKCSDHTLFPCRLFACIDRFADVLPV